MLSSELETMQTTAANIAVGVKQTIYQHEICNILRDKYVLAVLCFVHVVIATFGVVGNLLVGYSVLGHKSNWTVTNAFMFNLALANILLCLFVIPIVPVDLILHHWPLALHFCHVWSCVAFAQYYITMLWSTCCVYLSTPIVVVLREEITMSKMIIDVAVICIFSIVETVPFAFSHTTVHYNNTECVAHRPISSVIYDFRVLNFVMMFMIPLFVSAYLYIALLVKMSRIPIPFGASAEMKEAMRENRLLLTMVLAFVICWLPVHVTGVITNTCVLNVDRYHFQIVCAMFTVMALSSTCAVPLFYVWIQKISIKQFCLVGPCFNRPSIKSNNEDDVGTIATNLSCKDVADDVTH